MNRLATWATCALVKVVPVIPLVVYLVYPSLGCVMRPVCHFKVGPWLVLVLLAKSDIFRLNSQTHKCNQSSTEETAVFIKVINKNLIHNLGNIVDI